MMKTKSCAAHNMISKIFLLTILGSYFVLSSPVPELYRQQLRLIFDLTLAMKNGEIIEVAHPVNVTVHKGSEKEGSSHGIVLNVKNKSDEQTTTSSLKNSTETTPTESFTTVAVPTSEADQLYNSNVPENLSAAETANLVNNLIHSVSKVPSVPNDATTSNPEATDSTEEVVSNTETPDPGNNNSADEATEAPGNSVTNDVADVEKEVIRAAPSPDDRIHVPEVSKDEEAPSDSAIVKLDMGNGVEETESPLGSVSAPEGLSKPEINGDVPLEMNPNQDNLSNAVNAIINEANGGNGWNEIDDENESTEYSTTLKPSTVNSISLLDSLVTDSGLDAPVTFVAGGEPIEVPVTTESIETTTFSDKGVIEVIPDTTELTAQTENVQTTEAVVPINDVSQEIADEAPSTIKSVEAGNFVIEEETTVPTTIELDQTESSLIGKYENTVPPTTESLKSETSPIEREVTTIISTTEVVTPKTEPTSKPEIATTSTTTEAPQETTVSVKVITATNVPEPSTFTTENTEQVAASRARWNKLSNLLKPVLESTKKSGKGTDKEYKLVKNEGARLIAYAKEVHDEVKSYGPRAIAEFSGTYNGIEKKLSELAASGNYLLIKEEIQKMKLSLAKVEKNWFPLAKETPTEFLSNNYTLAVRNDESQPKIRIYKLKSKVWPQRKQEIRQ